MNLPDYLVDAHVHFWNPQRLIYPWLASVPALNRAFSPDDYAAATKAAKIGKMIFVECGGEPSQSLDEVKWVSELAACETRLKGIVAHASLERGAGVRGELSALAKSPLVKGVRRNLQGEIDADFCLQPDFIAGVHGLAEFGFSFDLCILHHQLPAVIELARRCPEIHFILDHCGKPAIRDGRLDPWRQHIRELAALPNVACKISGLVTEADPARQGAKDLQPYVKHALDCFGFDRVLFGGDWPVLTLAGDYSGWLETVVAAVPCASGADLRKLFQTNAEKAYHVQSE